MSFKRKDLLGLRDVSAEEITQILDTAEDMKAILGKSSKKSLNLEGKSIITLFYENSTRTRMSFELAAKYMSAVAANISATSSSVSKGETLIDTGKTLDMMGTDVIIMRHPMSGAPHLVAKNVNASVINAGDGMNEHPTQALLDMFTMRKHLGDLKGIKVAIVGDASHSRVARSNIWGLNTMGASVTICGPTTLIPNEMDKMGAYTTTNIEEAVKDADVVMPLRLQLERQKSGLLASSKEYAKYFGVNANVLKYAKEDAIVMHPGPLNRGVEITSEVADMPQSVINEQVTSGVLVRMAILELLAGR